MNFNRKSSFDKLPVPPESDLNLLVSRLAKPDANRRAAMPLLGRLVEAYPATSGQRILEHLTGQDYLSIRPVLMMVLVFSGAPEFFQPLFKLLWSPDPQLREVVASGLERSRKFEFDSDFLDHLLDLMVDPDENVRENIARIIFAQYFRPGRTLQRGWEPLSTVQVRRVITLTGKADGLVKASLLKILGSPKEVYLPAVQLFVESLSDHVYPSVIIASAEALREIKPPPFQAITPLLDCLIHKDERVRWHSVETLGRMGIAEPEVITALLAALNDPVSLVRQKAISALGVLGGKNPDPVIIERLYGLTYDTDENIRECATRQFGNLGLKESYILERLVEILADPDPTVQTEAIHALARLGNTIHIPLLEKFITPNLVFTIYSEIVGQQAENAIREIRDREA